MKFDYNKIYTDIISQVRFILERLRIFARIFLIGYMYVLYTLTQWIMGMDSISNAQSALASAIVGIATPLTKFYVDTGKNLYDSYETLEYKNSFVKYLDKFGFLLDRWRVFPTVFVSFFIWGLYTTIMWAMGLGNELTNQQVTFVSLYAGSASMVFGFFINTTESNINLEKDFIQRYNYNVENNDKKENDKKT